MSGLVIAYHSTPFAAGFPHDEWMHLGTRRAAEQRVANISPTDFGLPGGTLPTLLTVAITGRTYPVVLTDEQATLADVSGDSMRYLATDYELPDPAGYLVFRYVNSGEDAGSVSYLAHRSALAIRASEQLATPRYCETRHTAKEFA